VRQLQLKDSARIAVALGHLFVVDLDLIRAPRLQAQHEDFLVLVENSLKFLGGLSKKNYGGIERHGLRGQLRIQHRYIAVLE